MTRRWAVFISGTGSNLQALLDLNECIDIAIVVSNRKSALGLKKARRSGIKTKVFGKDDSWADLSMQLKSAGVDSIFLAGFMRIVPPDFLNEWGGRVVNIHPSFLPYFPGLNAIESSFNDKSTPFGVTVHSVIAEVDAGPIILQRTLERHPTLEHSEFALHRLEHLMTRKVALKWNPHLML